MKRRYTIVCICGMELEVEDMDTVKCPDCGRVYDDKGCIVAYENNGKEDSDESI